MNEKQLRAMSQKQLITEIANLKKKLLRADGTPRKDAKADQLQELHNIEAKLSTEILGELAAETNKTADPGLIENRDNYKKPEEGQSDPDLPEGADLGEGADPKVMPKTVDLVVLGKNISVTRQGIK